VTSARAGEASDPAAPDAPVIHPLLSDDAADLIAAHPELTPSEIYRHLAVRESVVELDDGTVERMSTVVWVDHEHVADDASPLMLPGEEPPAIERAPVALSTDAVVEGWLADPASAPPQMDVIVALDRAQWDDTVSVPYQQALAMITNDVDVRADLAQVRSDTVALRGQLMDDAIRPLLDDLEAAGGEVTSTGSVGGTLAATVTPASLEVLATHPLVLRIEEPSDSVPAGPGHAVTIEGPVDGIEVADHLQTEPYYDRGYYGDDSEEVGISEGGTDNLYNLHDVFEDNAGNERLQVCDGTSHTTCTYTFPDGNQHSTKVSSILLGDLTRGQDPGITSSTDRRKRSGVARRTGGVAINGGSDRVADLLGARSGVYIHSRSATWPMTDDEDCLGADTHSQDFNGLFESGVATFNAAGNNYFADTTDCVVGPPGSAIGVLPVNAVKIEDPPIGGGDADEVLHVRSARGGTATEGNGRSIIGLVALTGHNHRADAEPSSGTDYSASTDRFGITSAATPVVSGAAALFREWYLDTQSSLIDDPGILYANMLLMGDGLKKLQPLSYDHEGYSSLVGAGRLRLRAFDSTGLDAPAQWLTGRTCIDDGEDHLIDLHSGSDLPSGVDYIKAVAWWYDRSHGQTPGAGHDTYKLVIQRYDDSTSSWEVVSNDNAGDSRLRAIYAGSDIDDGTETFRVGLRGMDVDSDDEGCGTDSNNVYYAILWEDNARNDDTDLSTYVRPEGGI